MPKGYRIRQQDKQALVDLAREEIEAHQRKEIERLTTNEELAELLGISHKGNVCKYICGLPKELLDYRTRQFKSEIGYRVGIMTQQKSIGIFGQSKQQMTENGKRGAESLKRGNLGIFGQSKQQMTENGKRGAESLKRGNLGIFGRTEEEIREHNQVAGRLGGRVAVERKLGIHSLTSEQRIENSRKAGRLGGLITGKANGKINGSKAVEDYRKNAYSVEGRFCTSSQQEGAVALLLEKYVSGYNVSDGDNFQVRKGIGNGGIDFLVNEEFLEWHPIEPYFGRRGDIPVRKEAESYKKVIENLSDEDKKQFKANYKRVLAVRYQNLRQQAVDSSEYAGANVALVQDLTELYDFISKYSDSLPGFDEFRREFNAKVKYVKGFKVQKKKNLVEEAA